jgi:hypothetical protein
MKKGNQLSSNLLQEVRQNPNFYSLDSLVKDFIKKNDLPKEYDVKDTKHGKLIRWRKDHESYLMLSEERNGIEHLMQPYIGNSERVFTSNEAYYSLEGEIKRKKIKLEAEISERQDYVYKKAGNIPNLIVQPCKDGELKVEKIRIDKEKYWFVIESRMNEAKFKERLRLSTEKSFKEYDEAGRKTAIKAKNKILD